MKRSSQVRSLGAARTDDDDDRMHSLMVRSEDEETAGQSMESGRHALDESRGAICALGRPVSEPSTM